MSSFHFLQPIWFFGFILLLPGFVFFRHKNLALPALIQQIRVRYPALGLVDDEQCQKKLSSPGGGHYAVMLLLLLLILSLAQPVRDGQILESIQQADPVDLILVVNTSVSMVLKDYIVDGKQLDRMAMTRLLLERLVSEFNGRKIGLVILGRPSSLLLPLTDDFSLVKHFIGKIKTTLGGRNSDIAETLSLVQKQFPQSDKNQDQKNQQAERLVMLVSDGYDQLGAVSAESAVKQLRAQGFTLHTLAIGSPTKPDFSLGKGHLIYQPVDLKLMTQLARLGGGHSVHGKDLAAIEKVIDNMSIGSAEKKSQPGRVQIIVLYQYPLTLALIMLLIIMLPSARFSRERGL